MQDIHMNWAAWMLTTILAVGISGMVCSMLIAGVNWMWWGNADGHRWENPEGRLARIAGTAGVLLLFGLCCLASW